MDDYLAKAKELVSAASLNQFSDVRNGAELQQVMTLRAIALALIALVEKNG